jgi:hypothetical protein
MRSYSLARVFLFFFLFGSIAFGFELDTSTRGNWLTRYGADAHLIHAGAPKRAESFQISGAEPWVWTKNTTDLSALSSLDGKSRIASCWYSGTSFTVSAGINDGVQRLVAFYFLDWDMNGRVQKVERLDPATGAVIDEITLSDFHPGKYLTVNATGLVRLRLTRLAGHNAVLSGVFLGGPVPPAQQVATPMISPPGGDYSADVQVYMSTETEGADIYYTTDGRDPSLFGIWYLAPFTMSRAGEVRAIARKDGMTQSAEARAAFRFEGPRTEAHFLGFDRETMGTWMGNVGSDTYFMPMFAPFSASGTAIHHNATPRWVWLWSTDDPAALQKPPAANSSDRYAACWYDPDALWFHVDLGEHREFIFSVYALDYDIGGRVQQFELLNAANGELLDSQQVDRFHDGVYLKWRISSSVILRVTRLAGANAVLSGFFLDPTTGEYAATPQFTPEQGEYNGVLDVSITTATPSAQIRYTTDGTVPTASSTLYTEPIRVTQSVTFTARAFKEGMLPSGFQTAEYTITGGPVASARFLGIDRTTQGSWRSTMAYGEAASAVYGDAMRWSSFWDMKFIGTHGESWAEHIWAFNVTDPAALEKHTTSERLAACRYAGHSFTIELRPMWNPTTYKASLYFLDWDKANRVQKIEVVDLETNFILDVRHVSDFAQGAYYSWEAAGPVAFRVTRMSGPNAVVSGIFMD